MSDPEPRQDIRLEVADGFFLSPHARTDKAAYMEHFADSEIARNLLALPFPFTEADADGWFDRCQQSGHSQVTIFAVREPSSYLIGSIGIVGALIGGFLAAALFDAHPLDEFFDISTWLTAIVGALKIQSGEGSMKRASPKGKAKAK